MGERSGGDGDVSDEPMHTSTRSMHMVNSFDPARAGSLGPVQRRLLERRQAAMGAAYRLFYERPVHIVRGDGALLYDADGRDHLDAYNNVPVVGHSNERVHAAVCAALTRV